MVILIGDGNCTNSQSTDDRPMHNGWLGGWPMLNHDGAGKPKNRTIQTHVMHIYRTMPCENHVMWCENIAYGTTYADTHTHKICTHQDLWNASDNNLNGAKIC